MPDAEISVFIMLCSRQKMHQSEGDADIEHTLHRKKTMTKTEGGSKCTRLTDLGLANNIYSDLRKRKLSHWEIATDLVWDWEPMSRPLGFWAINHLMVELNHVQKTGLAGNSAGFRWMTLRKKIRLAASQTARWESAMRPGSGTKWRSSNFRDALRS